MNLQHLYYFKKIAELEHYTKASEALSITQPCLSHAISELEKELDANLFFRQGRNIKLTQYGKIFYKHISRAITELESGQAAIAKLKDPMTGSISIAHVSALNMTLIPLLVKEFYALPGTENVKIFYKENPTKNILHSLRQGDVDVGFGSRTDDQDMEFYPIFEEDLVLIVALNHALAQKESVSLSEIDGQAFIAYDNSCGIRDQIDKMLQDASVTPKNVCETVDNIMITGIVSANLGISIVPRYYGDSYYKVKSLELTGSHDKRELCMIYLKNAHRTSAADHFIEFVKSVPPENINQILAR